jgi:hypothetical protein
VDAYAKAFWLPKESSSEAEYEDAYFPRHTERRKGQRLRFAIADGATETSFSGLWARMLASKFVRRGINFMFTPGELRPLQDNWQKSVSGKTLSWYAEEKLASGAYSTLLGLELTDTNSDNENKRTWRAMAFGDSCLVQVRGGEIIEAFPLKDSASFTSRPDLLSSLPGTEINQSGAALIADGIWGCDDTFFLMTDALACWFFKEKEADRQPWNILRDLDTQGQTSFLAWVASLRSSGAMKNDDVTLVRIDIVG